MGKTEDGVLHFSYELFDDGAQDLKASPRENKAAVVMRGARSGLVLDFLH